MRVVRLAQAFRSGSRNGSRFWPGSPRRVLGQPGPDEVLFQTAGSVVEAVLPICSAWGLGRRAIPKAGKLQLCNSSTA
eukprot:3152897-Alexandrium_andersonii.AAC.1